MPPGNTPEDGWPILFFIHGGWLQIGQPGNTNPGALVGQGVFRGIVVCPAYRLNIFGFLAGRQLRQPSQPSNSVGNYGLWDQRLALTWVHKHIPLFSGNAAAITIAGYSAGAYSVFQQLAHELFMCPAEKRVIKRAIMFSNGPGPQPKSITLIQDQFDSVCSYLGIDTQKLSDTAVLQALQRAPMKTLNEAARSIDVHEFRAVTDGVFVHSNLFEAVMSGEFARRMDAAGVQLLTGECEEERHVYGTWRPLKNKSYAALQKRLEADYADHVVEKLLQEFYCPDQSLPRTPSLHPSESSGNSNWQQAFGAIYADLQVHALQRGLLFGLEKGLGRKRASQVCKRYRMEWRASIVDKLYPIKYGVTHDTDPCIWFFGNGHGDLTDGLVGRDAEVAKPWIYPVMRWIEGCTLEWETGDIRESRRLRHDGKVDIWRDKDWNRGVRVCEVVAHAQTIMNRLRARL